MKVVLKSSHDHDIAHGLGNIVVATHMGIAGAIRYARTQT